MDMHSDFEPCPVRAEPMSEIGRSITESVNIHDGSVLLECSETDLSTEAEPSTTTEPITDHNYCLPECSRTGSENAVQHLPTYSDILQTSARPQRNIQPPVRFADYIME